MPEYDDLFDMEALDRFTRELTEPVETPEEKLAREKAKKDALIDAIMEEELARITGRPRPSKTAAAAAAATAAPAAKPAEPPAAPEAPKAEKAGPVKFSEIAKAAKPEAPKEAPKPEAPKVEAPKEAAKPEAPKAEAPKEAPKAETPKEAPKAETPKPKAEPAKAVSKKEAKKEARKEARKAAEKPAETVIPAAKPLASQAQKKQAKTAKPTDDMAKKKKKKRIMTAVYAVSAILLVLAIAAAGLFVLDGGIIVDNIYVAGVPVGGLDRAAAVQEVNAATNNVYQQNELTIQLPDETITIAPELSEVRLDTERAVEAAWRYGRVLGLVKVPGITKAPAGRLDIDLSDCFKLNKDAVHDVLTQKADAVYSELRQTETRVEEREPQKTQDAEAQDGEEDGEEDGEKTEKRKKDKVLLITKGTHSQSLDVDDLYAEVLHALSAVDFTPIRFPYEEEQPEPVDFQALFDKHCTKPVNAAFNQESGELEKEKPGYGFDVEEVTKAFEKAEEGEMLEIPFVDLEAEVTVSDLKQYLFQDLLASYDSPHTAIYNRTINLELACEQIDGTILNDGEVFSFNRTVGERTAARGFKEAQVYVKGDTVEELGGGCCQVASTIYLCALMADLPIVERSCHYFQVTYVPLGMDATIYWGALDFQFMNNTGYPIRIDASVSGGYVHIALYGTETKDYTVRMTYDVTSRTEDGTSVISYMHKLDADGNEISVQRVASSYYHNHKAEEDEEDEEDEDKPDEEPPEPEPQPDPEPDPQPDPEPDPQPDPEPDPEPDPQPDPEPDPEPDPQPDPPPDDNPDVG